MTDSATISLSVEGMTCASCVGRVERALKATPGVTSAAVNLATETAQITTDGSTGPAALAQVLGKAGYPARVAEVELRVHDMTCASCVARVERALVAVPGVEEAQGQPRLRNGACPVFGGAGDAGRSDRGQQGGGLSCVGCEPR